MVIVGIFLCVFGLIKLFQPGTSLKEIQAEFRDVDYLEKIVYGALVFDALIELIGGIYLIFFV